MNSILRLMLRMLWRDWRAGELTVLAFALVLATAALSSVSFLTDRVQQALTLESHQLLGGDLLLTADHPWSAKRQQQAVQTGLQVARSTSFLSMVSADGATQLTDIKAVSANYPLRGTLRTALVVNGSDANTRGVPAPGTVWLDERLMAALALQTGMQVRLGVRQFTVAAVLTLEPDRGINVMALAPRLMLNEQDMASTGLVQEGSRVSYRLHLAGAPDQVAAFRHTAEAHMERGEKLETLDNARPEIRNVLERSQRFLRLAALLAVVLAAVAVALAADRYVRRHMDGCAVLRCLGASGNQLLVIHGAEFILLGVIVTVVGCLAGFLVQYGLQVLLVDLLRQQLPAPGWAPWAQGAAVSMTLVAGFALPPLLRLRKVSTLRVLRREWNAMEPVALSAWAAGAVLLALLMLWVAGEVGLWAIVLGGFVGAILIYALLARLLLAALSHLRRGGHAIGWRYGVANLRRHLRATLVQAVALGLSMTALLLLTVARGDLLAAWQGRVPADAPNRFVINIQPDQLQAINDYFSSQGLPRPLLEPMVRGRLVAINGRNVEPGDYANEAARRLVEREFNLSWTAQLPGGNAVTQGRWYGDTREPQFSVEQGLAETLGLKLGDALTYDIGATRVTAKITSLRKLEWDSMRVNFFVVAPPGLIDGLPASYISSFHLPQDKVAIIAGLVQRFPNLTVIDVAAIMRQLQDTINKVARAVQGVFAFALLAGLAVLYAALQATADERAHEIAVLRALGARERQLRTTLIAEFAVLGAVAGMLAGGGTALISMALARWAFHLPYTPTPMLLVAGLVGGVVLVVSAGLLGSRAAMRSSPLHALREAA